MDDQQFNALVEKAIKSLPGEFSEKINNVNILVGDWPNIRQQRVLKQRGGLLLGLYEGIPQTRRGSYGVGGVLPDKITIFKFPILMVSKNFEEIEARIKETVIHEIGHHFGLSDNEIKRAMRPKT